MNSGPFRVTGLALVDGLLAMIRLAHSDWKRETKAFRVDLFAKILQHVSYAFQEILEGVLPSEQRTVTFIRTQFSQFQEAEIHQIFFEIVENQDRFFKFYEEVKSQRADLQYIRDQLVSFDSLGTLIITQLLLEVDERKQAEDDRLAREREVERARLEEEFRREEARKEQLRLEQEAARSRALQLEAERREKEVREALEAAQREQERQEANRKAKELELRELLERRQREFNFQVRDSQKDNVSFRDLWVAKGLLSKNPPGRADNYIIDCLSEGFRQQEVFLTAQRIYSVTKDLHRPVLIGESNNIRTLVRLFHDLGSPKTEDSDGSSRYRSPEPFRERQGLLDLFEPLTRDKSEALYFLSFFIARPHSLNAKDDPITWPLTLALNPSIGYPPESQIAVRLKYFAEGQGFIPEVEELSINEMIQLVKSPDLVPTSALILKLRKAGIEDSRLLEVLSKSCLPDVSSLLLTEDKAEMGVTEDQLSILKKRERVNSFNQIERLTGKEYLELAEKYFEMSKTDSRIVKKYIEIFLSRERWPKEIDESMIRAQSDTTQMRLLELAIRHKRTQDLLLLDEILTPKVGNPLEIPSVLKALEIVSNDFVALLVSKHETSNHDLLFRAASSGALVPEQSARAITKLHELFDKSPDPAKAEEILLLTKDKSESSEKVLELALRSDNQYVNHIASAELAMRHFIEGRRDEAMRFAEPFAYQSLACAHLMYILQPENSEWLRLIARNHNEIFEEEIRLRFKAAGLMPATQLDDPYLHLDLARKSETSNKERKKRDPSWIKETWYCRKIAQASQEGKVEQCPFHPVPGIESSQHKSMEGTDDPLLFTPFALDQALENLNAGSALYSWQLAALASWAEHGRHGIVEAVTGSGKSRVGALAISEALTQGYAVLVVVPTRVLSDQWMTQSLDGFRKRGLVDRIGNYATQVAQVPFSRGARPGRITVAVLSGSVEGEVRLWKKEKTPGTPLMIVADEVHWLGRGIYQNLMMTDFSRRLGLTATLLRDEYERSRSKNFFAGDPVFRYEFDQAIDQKVIVPFTLIMLGISRPNDIDYQYRLLEKELRDSREAIQRYSCNDKGSIVPVSELYEHCLSLLKGGEKRLELLTVAQKYLKAQDQMNDLLDNSMAKTSDGAIALIASLVRKVKLTAVFSDYVKNADNVLAIFKAREVDCELIEGRTNSHERERILENLDQERIHAVVSPRVLDEGVDIKNLTVGLFTGQVRNRRALTQRLGRILRTNPGKSQAYAVILYVRGTQDDPTREGNERLQRSQFDFVGRNAQGEIRNYIVGEDDQLLSDFVDSISSDSDSLDDDLVTA